MEGRNVFPWRLSRLRTRSGVVCPLSRNIDSLAWRLDLRSRNDRGLSRSHRQFHKRGAVGAAERRAVGNGVSQRRPGSASSKPALRSLAGGIAVVYRPRRADTARRAAAAGTYYRAVCAWLRNYPLDLLAVPRA